MHNNEEINTNNYSLTQNVKIKHLYNLSILFLQSGSEVALWNMENMLNELWTTYLQETDEDAECGNGVDKPEPIELMKSKPSIPCAEEQLVNMCGAVEKIRIQQRKDGLAGVGEGWNSSLGGKKTDGEANIGGPETNMQIKSEDAQNMNVTLKRNEASAVNCDKDDCQAPSSSPDPQLTHPPAKSEIISSTVDQAEQEIKDDSFVKHVKNQAPRKKSSVEGRRAYIDYLKLDGVEVILLSPSRLNDLSSLSEVSHSNA